MPRRRQSRIQRYGLIRPGVGLAALLPLAGLCCYAGLLLDERALMAATVSAVSVVALALALTVVQWLLMGCAGWERQGWRRWLMPRTCTLVRHYERIDQHGAVLERLAGEVPERRGLYRLTGVAVSWHGPLGLFAARRLVRANGETMVLPRCERGDQGAIRAADMRLQGQEQAELSGGVRSYAPGDPIKLISWRHTAHRGQLMTRETARDTRVALLLVLNTAVPAARLDAEVAAVLPLADDLGNAIPVVTDGVECREGEEEVKRFLCAVCPEPAADSADGGVGTIDVRANAVVRHALRRQGPVQIVLCDASERGELAAALRRTPIADRLHEVDALGEAPKEVLRESHGIFASLRPSNQPKDVGVWPRCVCAASLLAFLGIALIGVSGLVNPEGTWIWFAAALLAVAAIESCIPWRTAWRGTARVLGYAACAMLAAAVLVFVKLRYLLASGQSLASVGDRASEGHVQAVEMPTDPRAWAKAFLTAMREGFDQLNEQLPPLRVPALADVFLIVLVALLAVFLRCLLTWHYAVPAMVVFAVAALAADSSIAGHVVPWWAIGVLALAFCLSLWAVHPERIALPVPFLASLIIAAITLAATPSAERLAYSVPLSIGDGGGMFTSNTVSPMIDLKRNIAAGSSNTGLRDQASRRMAMRLTTLDDFNGDTWGYDHSLALDAGLYGSGIQLGRDADNTLDRRQRFAMDPLGAYLWALGYDGYSANVSGEGSIERYATAAGVRIDSLHSRFLPIPGMPMSISGVNSDWLSYQDGTVYNRDSGTSSDMSYRVLAAYLAPISADSGFSQIDAVHGLYQDLFRQPAGGVGNFESWIETRRSLPGSGLGEIHGDTLVIPFTMDGGNNLRGANGWLLGKANDKGTYMRTDSEGKSVEVPGDIQFDDDVIQRLGLGEDGFGIGVGPQGRYALAVPLVSLVAVDAQGGTNDVSAANDAAIQAWYNDASRALNDAGYGMVGAQISPSGGSRSQAASWVSRFVDQADRRARSSRFTALPEKLPEHVNAVIKQAHAAGLPEKADGYESQVNAMRWLVHYFSDKANGFTYSLDAPDGDGRSNLQMLDAFLDPESGHSGYCQHYASALAVLGRALGVSTRIVLGYNAGVEPRGEDGYYTVQAKQLHAWTEAYIDGIGWVPFDVTPPTAENGSAASGQDQTDGVADSLAGDVSTSESAAPDSADDSADDADVADRADDSRSNNDRDKEAADSRQSSGHDDSLHDGLSAGIASLPMWAKISSGIFGVLLLVGIAVGAPRGWLWCRRLRVLGVVRRAERGIASGRVDHGDTDRAWRFAWAQIMREARRRGLRQSVRSDTDSAICERIVELYPPERSALIRRVCRNASAVAFGGTGESVSGLANGLKSLFAVKPSRCAARHV